MENEVSKALQADIKNLDRELQQSTRNSFIKLSMEFKGNMHPLRYFREKQLETSLICDNCSLEYAIFGVFAFCPDCGEHNSYQILVKNIELIDKVIRLSLEVEDKELAHRLIEDALENAVSSFDGFGRSICTAYSNGALNPELEKNLSFQNIKNARDRVKVLFGFDFADGLDVALWEKLITGFQKRHLLTHKMGVIDQEYMEKVMDPVAVIGRKIKIDHNDVIEIMDVLKIIGNNMLVHFTNIEKK